MTLLGILGKRALVVWAALAWVAASPALACGTMADWIAKYDAVGASDDQRRAALSELTDSCSDYAGKADDRRLLPVLADAVERGIDYDLVQLVYDTYLCLPGARDEPGYEALWRAMDRRACLSDETLAGWVESRVDGALLRRRASPEADTIGWLRQGAMAERLGADGDWIEVLTWTGRRGWVHGSLLAPYLD